VTKGVIGVDQAVTIIIDSILTTAGDLRRAGRVATPRLTVIIRAVIAGLDTILEIPITADGSLAVGTRIGKVVVGIVTLFGALCYPVSTERLGSVVGVLEVPVRRIIIGDMNDTVGIDLRGGKLTDVFCGIINEDRGRP
jgi:hypothetical protein